jgi:hypothetical protein
MDGKGARAGRRAVVRGTQLAVVCSEPSVAAVASALAEAQERFALVAEA